MFEKIGIRISISIIFVWLILTLNIVTLIIDGYIFAMIFLYSILLSLIIEMGYTLLRKHVQYTPYIVLALLFLLGLGYYFLGWGMYVGFLAYVFGSWSFDLYREFKMYKLLQNALRSHSDE